MASDTISVLKDEDGYVIHNARLKKLLGLPSKLGPRPKKPVLLGTVRGIEIWDMPANSTSKAKRAHRLHAWVDNRFIPTGRLHQAKPRRRT